MKCYFSFNTKFDFKLWFAFWLIIVIPASQNIIRLYFIGDMPNEWGFNIASQIQWLSVLYEIIKEALLIPLFFMFFSAKKINDDYLLNNAVSGIIIVFFIHCILSIFIFFFARDIILFTHQSMDIIDQTVDYIRLESIAILFSVVVEYLIVYLAVTNKLKELFMLFLIKSILLVISDLFLISQYDFSLSLNINGIAISNLIINVLLTIYILYKIDFLKYFFNGERLFNLKWIFSWFKLGAFSGLESFIRNSVFFLMILTMINQIGEQGSYWIANSIIWGILLSPSLALSEVVKRDVAQNVENIKTKTLFYLILTILFSLCWIFIVPYLEVLLTKGLNINNAVVAEVIKIQTVFYLIFMFNYSIFDATIKGLGITKYMLYQSIFIDIGYYSGVFILYKFGVVSMSIYSISYIFGIGMLLDLFPTLYLYIKALHKYNIKFKDIFSKKLFIN